jgi:hypothetical protein
LRTHSQTLDKKGSKTKHGRVFLWFGKNEETDLTIEWNLLSKRLGFSIGLGHYDCALSLGLRLFLFSIYFELENSRLKSWIRNKTKRHDEQYGSGRELGINFHSSCIWVNLWNDPMQSRSTDPKWWHISIDLKDKIFGKETYKSFLLDTGECFIRLPEKEYVAKYTKKLICYKRSRWFEEKKVFLNVEVPKGIPIPGKGTTSYNCGDDAIFGFSRIMYLDDTVNSLCEEEAISILKTRQKYGTINNKKYAVIA